MKKTRELWWFLVPFVLLPVASIVVPLLWPDGVMKESIQFLGGAEYLRLLLSDPLFWVGVGSAFVWTWVLGGVLGLILGLLVLLLRRWLPLARRWWYVAVFAAATLIATAIWAAGLRLTPGVYQWLYFLQMANAAAFFVWLVELVWKAIKKPKMEVDAE